MLGPCTSASYESDETAASDVQLEELRLQLQDRGHGPALSAHIGPGLALSPLPSHQSATTSKDQHKLPNGAETGHPSVGSSACSPLHSTASTDCGSSGVGSPAAISRQSSFSAHSHADVAAAAALYAAYAQQPRTLDNVAHPAVPLKAHAASIQSDKVDAVLRSAESHGSAYVETDKNGKHRSGQCPELRPQPMLHAADLQETVEVRPAVLVAQAGADQADFEAEHRAAKRWGECFCHALQNLSFKSVSHAALHFECGAIQPPNGKAKLSAQLYHNLCRGTSG